MQDAVKEPPTPVPITDWFSLGAAVASETEVLIIALLMIRAHDEARLKVWVRDALTEEEAYAEVYLIPPLTPSFPCTHLMTYCFPFRPPAEGN